MGIHAEIWLWRENRGKIEDFTPEIWMDGKNRGEFPRNHANSGHNPEHRGKNVGIHAEIWLWRENRGEIEEFTAEI